MSTDKASVVVELKVTEFKAQYISQVKKYMNYIDMHIKSLNENNTIGIIVCKKENSFEFKYCYDNKVFTTTYELEETL